ncbi:MAG: L-threonylcarbamoyladenylate synthase [Bacteroidota bacterium]
MVLKIHPDNPQARLLQHVVNELRSGSVIVYPTDTMYALGCDINNKKAVEKICAIKGIDPKKSRLTCVCENLSILGQYANQIDTTVFKMMKRAFPGPYVFVLEASKKIPRHFRHRDTVGIRIAGNNITQRLVEMLGNPIASISLPFEEDTPEDVLDPVRIDENFGKRVDLIVDGGYGKVEVSTVIDASKGEGDIEVIREGAGDLAKIGLILND